MCQFIIGENKAAVELQDPSENIVFKEKKSKQKIFEKEYKLVY